MKAICVTSNRTLEVRDVPTPEAPPPGHLLVDIVAATITHGDKFFLTRPLPGAAGLSSGGHDVYGSNAGGAVVALGAGVPLHFAGRQVAIYKSIARSPATVGLWCERALVPYRSCLGLPNDVSVADYSGSFANIITVQAFLSEILAEGHKGIVVTAGNSATGRIAVSLARRLTVPAISLVRSARARDDLVRHGAEHVLLTKEDGFEGKLGGLAEALGATAVFDGVGGCLLSRVAPNLPMNATIYVYGFLGGPAPVVLPTVMVMAKNLTLRRFANLESATVRDPERLAVATKEIEGLIDDPLFRTRIGRTFGFDEIDQAMAFEATPGARAVLLPAP